MMTEHFGSKFGSQPTTKDKTFLHFILSFWTSQGIPVQFLWCAQEHSLDIVGKRRAETQEMKSVQSGLKGGNGNSAD